MFELQKATNKKMFGYKSFLSSSHLLACLHAKYAIYNDDDGGGSSSGVGW